MADRAVPPNIQSELDAIMEAVYGEQVRGSIHDALAKMNAQLSNAILNQLIQVDNTLTLTGYGADAKKVGDLLGNALVMRSDPASGTDLNTIATTGIYRLLASNSYENKWVPVNESGTAIPNTTAYLEVVRNASNCKQTMYYLTASHNYGQRCAVRFSINATATPPTWTEWLENIDDTLEVYGQAADAKITGDRINTVKTNSMTIGNERTNITMGANLNSTTAVGSYSVKSTSVTNLPEEAQGVLYVIAVTGTSNILQWYIAETGSQYTRIKTGSTWSDWKKGSSGAGESIAAPFSSSSSTSYAVGDYVTYKEKLWKCKSATTGGTWNASKWDEAIVMDELESFSSDTEGSINALGNRFNNEISTVHSEIDRLGNETTTLREDVDRLNDGGLIIKDSVIEEDVFNWLDEHPEATTTVQDRSITDEKIAIGALGYVTPQMFGARPNDRTYDSTVAIQTALNYGTSKVFLPEGDYYTSDIVSVPSNTEFFGVGKSSRIINRVESSNKRCVLGTGSVGAVAAGTGPSYASKYRCEFVLYTSTVQLQNPLDIQLFNVGDIVFLGGSLFGYVPQGRDRGNPFNQFASEIIEVDLSNSTVTLADNIDNEGLYNELLSDGYVFIYNLENISPTEYITKNISVHHMSLIQEIKSSTSGYYAISNNCYNGQFHDLWIYANALSGSNFFANGCFKDIDAVTTGGMSDNAELQINSVFDNVRIVCTDKLVHYGLGFVVQNGYKVIVKNCHFDFFGDGYVKAEYLNKFQLINSTLINTKSSTSNGLIKLSKQGNNVIRDNTIVCPSMYAVQFAIDARECVVKNNIIKTSLKKWYYPPNDMSIFNKNLICDNYVKYGTNDDNTNGLSTKAFTNLKTISSGATTEVLSDSFLNIGNSITEIKMFMSQTTSFDIVLVVNGVSFTETYSDSDTKAYVQIIIAHSITPYASENRNKGAILINGVYKKELSTASLPVSDEYTVSISIVNRQSSNISMNFLTVTHS